ncbi:DUF4142 domain-containing protein [Qaidamihabitans albus]|uniref:DUF4142 domain-containing protein n=1 Tax=Qaidamihabitans albus TaxID=2795733 RepID=UPI001F230128|nr:DUF4142 domain-containing protein [Qaidamihabitans albus]
MTPARRSLMSLAAGIAVVALTAACDDSNSYGGYYSSDTGRTVQIQATAQSGTEQAGERLHGVEAFDIGRMVVDDKGFALYRYDRDSSDPPVSNCTGACTERWPPVRAAGTAQADGMAQELLGSVTRSDGTDQLTLAGWPLYRYADDEMPGETAGEGIDGTWFPITPDGGKARPTPGLATPDAGAPVADTDAELLVKVRQAGLWEMPAASWARTRGESSRVRSIGLPILVDHGRLDAATKTVAERLGVELPDRPTVKQQDWLGEMRGAGSDAEFDRVFANRLRLAHGKVLTYIANVRAGTRNDTMRAFANTGNTAVLRHINLLESTGLVDYEALPAPVLDASATSAGAALDMEATDIFLIVVLATFLGGATLLSLWLVRGPRRRAARGTDAAGSPPAAGPEPGEKAHA